MVSADIAIVGLGRSRYDEAAIGGLYNGSCVFSITSAVATRPFYCRRGLREANCYNKEKEYRFFHCLSFGKIQRRPSAIIQMTEALWGF
jgi:hypothetical protein